MDVGHYNCRDYYVSPHFAPTTLVSPRNSDTADTAITTAQRHESFDELEQRARSPASAKPKFPLLRLPVELRQQIFSHLLPRTRELVDTSSRSPAPNRVVWQRGEIGLFGVCRQLHDECAELVYGGNTFLLYVTYAGIVFRFNWLLSSGLAPTRRFPFLELMPKKYLMCIKRVVINIEHVDSYTAAIKFNVSGKGLVHGLRGQIQRLVTALNSDSDQQCKAEDLRDGADCRRNVQPRRLTRVDVRVAPGNDVLEQIKARSQRQRSLRSASSDDCGSAREAHSDGMGADMPSLDDLNEMLCPFRALSGVGDVTIGGAVSLSLVQELRTKMTSLGSAGDTVAAVNPQVRSLAVEGSLRLPL